MHPRQPIPDGLVRLALHQTGIITGEQALGLGLSRHVIARLIGSAAWTPISPGIFYVAPGEPPWDGLAWGGILVGGQGARLGPEASGPLPVSGPNRRCRSTSTCRPRGT